MRETFADVDKLIRQMTAADNVSWPNPSPPTKVLSSTHGSGIVNGRRVLRFDYLTSGLSKTVWADPKTLRVVQMAVNWNSNGRSNFFWHGFQYGRQPPAGTFDWSPPPGAHIRTF